MLSFDLGGLFNAVNSSSKSLWTWEESYRTSHEDQENCMEGFNLISRLQFPRSNYIIILSLYLSCSYSPGTFLGQSRVYSMDQSSLLFLYKLWARRFL